MSVPTLASLPTSAPARGTAAPSGARRDHSGQDAGVAGDFAAVLEATSSIASAEDVTVTEGSTGDTETTTGAVAPTGAVLGSPVVPVVVPPVPVPPVPVPPAPVPADEALASSGPELVTPAPATLPDVAPTPDSSPAAAEFVAPAVAAGPVAAQAVPSTATSSPPSEERAAGGAAPQDGRGAQPGPAAGATPFPAPAPEATATIGASTSLPEPQPVSLPAPTTGPAAPAAAAAVRTLDTGQAPAAPAVPHTPVVVPLATQLAPRVSSLRALGEGVHRLVMRVQPEEIGSVRVVAEITSDRVRIELHGGTEQAREALRAALPDLRRDLLGTDPPGTRAELDLGSAGRQPGRDRGRPGTSGEPPGPDGVPAPVQLVLPRAGTGRLDVVT